MNHYWLLSPLILVTITPLTILGKVENDVIQTRAKIVCIKQPASFVAELKTARINQSDPACHVDCCIFPWKKKINTGILRFPFHGMFYMQSSSYNISSCDNSNLQVKEKWLIKPPLNMIR
jgi:hypothetical protein